MKRHNSRLKARYVIDSDSASVHLFFDLDGTLTDSSLGIVRCFVHALKRVGVEVTELPLLVCVGPPLPVAFRTLLASDEAQVIEQAIAAYRERFETTGIFENALYPGVRQALAELQRQGHRMRVVTAKPRPYAIRILEHFEIDRFFDAVHGPTLADRTHNKAILIEEALREVESSHAVMIGDRDEDIRAAKANAIPAIAARWGYGSAAELSEAGPSYAAEDIDDVVRWVRRWRFPASC
jgi:phosphoglycolate phosphatase